MVFDIEARQVDVKTVSTKKILQVLSPKDLSQILRFGLY
jgi:hypothetical protein